MLLKHGFLAIWYYTVIRTDSVMADYIICLKPSLHGCAVLPPIALMAENF